MKTGKIETANLNGEDKFTRAFDLHVYEVEFNRNGFKNEGVKKEIIIARNIRHLINCIDMKNNGLEVEYSECIQSIREIAYAPTAFINDTLVKVEQLEEASRP